jgi:hypothetical protein
MWISMITQKIVIFEQTYKIIVYEKHHPIVAG